MSGAIRIGVDVGGTFTKAVAIETGPLRLLAHAVVPTSHAPQRARPKASSTPCATLLATLGEDRGRVALVAFSTTQAMNALLEGDVGRVGVLGIGSQPDLRAARKRTRVGSVALAPGHSLETEHAFVDVTGGLDQSRRGRRARDARRRRLCLRRGQRRPRRRRARSTSSWSRAAHRHAGSRPASATT